MTREDDRIPMTLGQFDGSVQPVTMCRYCGRIAEHHPQCSVLPKSERAPALPQCSFCGRTDVPKLVRGRAGLICRECAVDVLALFGGAQ